MRILSGRRLGVGRSDSEGWSAARWPPAIDKPRFLSATEAKESYPPRTQTIVIRSDDEIHAYPTLALNWHQIVNDRISKEPISATSYPLCGTPVTFSKDRQ